MWEMWEFFENVDKILKMWEMWEMWDHWAPCRLNTDITITPSSLSQMMNVI